ncbi:hypothetical protein RhiJN_27834 [Ceratobasidium sp. AG-Ba]|nr:hypothetical protein RhiJN_10621 [Ceratobasidium sp. AG-Ba]QRV99815.1 hypothetical protein RhiJN_27834 [Ceratobasidium sp. AG-Ba]
MPAEREHHEDDESPSSSRLMINSRQLTRTCNMYWSANSVIKQAKLWCRKNPAQREAFEAQLTDEEKQTLALVKLLIRLDPEVVEELARRGRGSRVFSDHTETLLSKGQSNAKAEDMRKCRNLLGKWLVSNPPLDPEDSSTRGMNNPTTAYLLASLEVDWDDEDERRKFMAGDFEISEMQFPRLCYPGGKGDKDRPWIGAFLGELLIKGGRAILLSPAASTSGTPGMNIGGARGHRRTTKTRGPIGLAKRYDMTEITVPFIAYVTVVVRHCLTSDKEYSDEGSGFDYELFYTEICKYLQDAKYEQITSKVLEHWNKEIFGQAGNRKAGRGVRTAGRGTRALLDAALEAGEDLGLGDGDGGGVAS